LENRNANPQLIIETTQQVHDEWVKNGKKELPGFLELPEACRVLLVGIGSDNQDLSLVPAESVTPAAIGQMALQMLWKEMLDPPSDARSRIQVIDRALEVGGFTGKNAELHLHEHHHEFLSSPLAQRMIAEKQLEILDEREQAAKNAEAITAEVITTPEVMGDNNLATEIGGRFDHILVDEYQDTNRLQSKILLRLKPEGRGLMVVGDDAQSIYSFRAATVRNILDFPEHFQPAADVVTLEQNYRSTQSILDACNRVIRFAKERYTKNLRSDRRSKQKPFLTTVADEASQARFVAQQILDSREAGVLLKNQAVLFRAPHHSAQPEIELVRRNIPFVKYGGLKFLEAAHVKDVLSILRWCENPRDRVAGFRAVQLLPGIGPSTAAKILDQVEGEPHATDVLYGISVPKAAAENWPAFAKLVEQMRQGKTTWPVELELVQEVRATPRPDL